MKNRRHGRKNNKKSPVIEVICRWRFTIIGWNKKKENPEVKKRIWRLKKITIKQSER